MFLPFQACPELGRRGGGQEGDGFAGRNIFTPTKLPLLPDSIQPQRSGGNAAVGAVTYGCVKFNCLQLCRITGAEVDSNISRGRSASGYVTKVEREAAGYPKGYHVYHLYLATSGRGGNRVSFI